MRKKNAKKVDNKKTECLQLALVKSNDYVCFLGCSCNADNALKSFNICDKASCFTQQVEQNEPIFVLEIKTDKNYPHDELIVFCPRLNRLGWLYETEFMLV